MAEQSNAAVHPPLGAESARCRLAINLDGSGQGSSPTVVSPAAAICSPPRRAVATCWQSSRREWFTQHLAAREFATRASGCFPVPRRCARVRLCKSRTLSTDAQVTVEVVNANKLVDNAPQSKGDQTIRWDGTDASGKTVPAGDYLVKLSAQVAGSSTPLERYATARILDAAR